MHWTAFYISVLTRSELDAMKSDGDCAVDNFIP